MTEQPPQLNLVESNRTSTKRQGSLMTFIVVAVLATAVDITALWLLPRFTSQPAMATIIALLPLPGNLTLIFLVLRYVRSLDEFKQRIHFEAVVFAFLATGVSVFVYSFFRQAQLAGPLNAGLVWFFMSVCYVVGYWIALRRYK